MKLKIKELIHELKHHLPFTAIATAIAILSVIILLQIKIAFPEDLFEIIHPLHILASSFVTSAIFYKYKKKILPSILIGVMASIIVGSISDVIFPYLGGNILSLNTSFHLPIIETPFLILIASFGGSILGISLQKTRLSHSIHVFLSAFASLFYLFAFSNAFSLIYIILAFLIVVISVIIPCCISDIVLPFFFLKKKIKSCHCH